MTEATQTTFFRDFFGKEMSENSGLANQLTTGGRAKMTEATQTTFSRDFFGKEMSENSGLV